MLVFRRRSLGLTLVLAAALAAAGCGGSKKSSDTTTTSGLSSVATAANCKQLADLGSQLASQLTGANGDVAKQAALLKEFAEKTPEDIRPDFETLADAFTKLSAAMKGIDLSKGIPDAATLAKLQKLGSEYSGPK